MATGLNRRERKEFRLFEGRPDLWTRELAREIREKIERNLDRMPVGSVLVIDATGVEVFDFSFASELFARLVLHLPIEYEGRCVAVKGLDLYPEENLAPALQSSGVMMLVIEDDESWHLIGKFGGTDVETLNALSNSTQPISATDLGEQLEINGTACNERLVRLTRFGLIHRVSAGSGRLQYRYSSFV